MYGDNTYGQKERIFHEKTIPFAGGLLIVSLLLASFAIFDPTSAVGSHGQHTTTPAMVKVPKLTCPGAQDGNLLIDVSEKVKNDADSGKNGYWAMDTFTRTIKVWNVGTFTAAKGQQSPGSTSTKTVANTLIEDKTGTFVGGAVVLIKGSLNVAKPDLWTLEGNVHLGQSVGYKCVIAPDGTSDTCPGFVDWMSKYFAKGFTSSEPCWGWTYTAKERLDGVWYTWSSGASTPCGDILDVDPD